MLTHTNLWKKLLAFPLAICGVLSLPALTHAQAAPTLQIRFRLAQAAAAQQVVDDGSHRVGCG